MRSIDEDLDSKIEFSSFWILKRLAYDCKIDLLVTSDNAILVVCHKTDEAQIKRGQTREANARQKS